LAVRLRAGYGASMERITHAQIEPTTRCNFTCGFCAGRSMAQGDLDWDAFVAFLDAHPDLEHVELQGEGEPMLHARFFDMVELCRDRGIRAGIITNGSLLSEDRVERLLAAGLSSVHISMESSDPAQFAAIRGGKFDKVRDGIDGGIVAQPLQIMPAYRRRYGRAMADQMLPKPLMPRFAAIRQGLAQAAPVRSNDHFFYYSLFAGFGSDPATCPWLDRGAYLGQSGEVTGCCFMKDESFGRADDPARIAGRRAGLRSVLARGDVPDACLGCSTATTVARRAASLATSQAEGATGA